MSSSNFLPGLQSDQVNNLARTEFAENIDSDFLTQLSRYTSEHELLIKAAKENYDAHFDWSLMAHMCDQVVIRNSAEPNPLTGDNFYFSIDSESICEDPQFTKQFWRMRSLRDSNMEIYEIHLELIEEFIPAMQRQLELM